MKIVPTMAIEMNNGNFDFENLIFLYYILRMLNHFNTLP